MRFSFAGPMLDLLPLEIIPVVLNIHSTGTEVALIPRYSCNYTEYWERRLMLSLNLSEREKFIYHVRTQQIHIQVRQW